ncbi:type I-E CRISPR-associated protein Cse1/CasA [Corynebacterium pseudodiphtheriticum]|uniref:type I-E CRISPR-associated protein Cse1/CasA n=1 Tax=Corynebacterium pseudodiphtheriticum TaxID=37637 RepID=UPI00254D71AD|nr:type I-E CRISPR-associated protein Cse1/CasA [Corynebacterium pseudodiphtheriticum]MDK8583663.1 type I-E CRISPR-associated protein Cse1/CasA [Corynebacterium pseudodiphtheriticum]MDK8839667.1 type I-E CRISPR-associated protein Cse1/CasA [Corynebacterium pseudodiphtheriticum]
MTATQHRDEPTINTFNLIDEPWIPCRTINGARTLSIREIFDGSGEALAIVGDSPTQDYAVLRVLLAIFWRAHHHKLAEELTDRRALAQFEWDEWWTDTRTQLNATGVDDTVLDYLATVHNRFDLLDAENPFMQVADLHTPSNTQQEVARIIPDAEQDYFTMRTAAGRQSLSYPEAARWLIHTQAFDYSGIKSGAVGDERVKGGKGYPIGQGWTGMTGGTYVLGNNLLETLILNTPESAVIDTGKDEPAWERKQDTAAQRSKEPQPQGPADLATWQSRRVRLFVDADVALVTRVLVSNGDQIPDAGKNVLEDPMTPYRFSPNQSKKGLDAYYARPYDTQRTMWRSLDPLIVVDGDPGFKGKDRAPIRPANLDNLARISKVTGNSETLDVAIVSMEYGAQASSVATIVSASIGLPLHLLRNDRLSKAHRQIVRDAAETTKNAAISLGWFSGQLTVAAGGDYAFDADVADRLYTILEPQFVSWLRNLSPEDIEQKAVSWQSQIEQELLLIAEELVRGAGQKAMIGRTLEGDEEANARIINAGSLYRALRYRLRKDLPLLKDQKATEHKGKSND